MSRRPFAAAALAAAILAALAPAAEARLARGETVQVRGIVTDTEGRPLDGVQVVFEASRAVFSLRRFQPVLRNTARVAAVTDASGGYALRWPWDSYYNHFELVVGVPVRTAGGEELQVLERKEVTNRLGRDAEVAVPIVVEHADFIRNLRRFLETVDSADEERVHRAEGRPDRIEITGERESWWYFARGRRYDFQGGRLVEVKTFDPVRRP
ncbi:MAG TPA: Ig-like domain-containing protein [Thermoanaerobaculia bacterium]